MGDTWETGNRGTVFNSNNAAASHTTCYMAEVILQARYKIYSVPKMEQFYLNKDRKQKTDTVRIHNLKK